MFPINVAGRTRSDKLFRACGEFSNVTERQWAKRIDGRIFRQGLLAIVQAFVRVGVEPVLIV